MSVSAMNVTGPNGNTDYNLFKWETGTCTIFFFYCYIKWLVFAQICKRQIINAYYLLASFQDD